MSYEEERRRLEKKMQKKIEAYNKRVYGLLTNVVVSTITAVIVTLILTN